ncbi:hypothetical protein JAAARDRAFT_36149 [Jaapia argillacea MUCL 33604]|uniref:Uncharacterized protein n=1 Tax=Jaapia argillacea MUCL 33604 TaxID=933084 RepID=A0A067Q230_9AGAM|nr:hypothetical protein JAAARDRAFT_36149 [Jaapia argillacea MUCL 33604]
MSFPLFQDQFIHDLSALPIERTALPPKRSSLVQRRSFELHWNFSTFKSTPRRMSDDDCFDCCNDDCFNYCTDDCFNCCTDDICGPCSNNICDVLCNSFGALWDNCQCNTLCNAFFAWWTDPTAGDCCCPCSCDCCDDEDEERKKAERRQNVNDLEQGGFVEMGGIVGAQPAASEGMIRDPQGILGGVITYTRPLAND